MSVLTTILARWPAAILWCQGSFPWAHGGESESESEVAQSWQTLCDPMDCTLQDSSIHGIFQAGVLEWGAIASLLNFDIFTAILNSIFKNYFNTSVNCFKF